MGRGKIDIKRIENANNRQVTFTKRRKGVIKKAEEIAVLCDADVSLVIFSSSGRMFEYCSPSTTLIKLLEEYQKISATKLWDAKHENLSKEEERIKKENDSMLIELRHLRGEDITSLNYKELMSMEDALENGLTNVRERKMELYEMLKKNGRMLEEDNRRLSCFLQQQQQMGMDQGSLKEMGNGYSLKVEDYPPPMHFAFRVQPSQPNLHDKK